MELAIWVWFIEVFSDTHYTPSTVKFVGLSFLFFIVTMLLAGMAESTSCNRNYIKDWWNFVKRKLVKPWLVCLGIVVTANVLGGLMPDKEAAYKIAAAYGVQKAYEAATGSEEVKRMAGKSLQVLETSMDRYLTKDVSNDGLPAEEPAESTGGMKESPTVKPETTDTLNELRQTAIQTLAGMAQQELKTQE